MSKTKKTLFRIVLTNATNGFTLTSLVWAYDEDTAMDIALRQYEGLQVFDVQLA